MAWNYFYGTISSNLPKNIRKLVLIHNLAKNTEEIVQKFLNKPENCDRDTFRMVWTNFHNPNFSTFYPNLLESDTIILLWDCCNGYEVIFSEDLPNYKDAHMCSSCQKILDDMFKDIQPTTTSINVNTNGG